MTLIIHQRTGEEPMSHPDHDIDPLIKAEELARILGKPVNTVYDLPIPKVWIGERTVRWKPEDVQEFIDQRYDDVA